MLLSVIISLKVNAQEKRSALKDSTDNSLDLSHYLYNLHGFLPVVSPITEPAVGYGAVLAGLNFIPKKGTSDGKFRMPDVAGVAGGYTQNNTWFAGAAYAGFWKQDHIRYRGVIGYGDIKIKFYRTGLITGKEYETEFRLKSYFLLQQAIFRIAESKFLLGGRYQLIKINAVPVVNRDLPGFDQRNFDLLNSGIGGIAEFENYDNLLSPSKGFRINLTYDQYLQILGSGLDFGRLLFFTHYYQPVIKHRWVAGFRFEGNLATGNAPFYMLPFISLRGVPAMRYQGDLTGLIETEQEIMISSRWSLVGFGGYGKAFKINDRISENASAWNAGGGFRYLIARLFGLKMGLDVAKGPEDWAIYVVVGSSWMK